jgi:hypothetical protein
VELVRLRSLWTLKSNESDTHTQITTVGTATARGQYAATAAIRIRIPDAQRRITASAGSIASNREPACAPTSAWTTRRFTSSTSTLAPRSTNIARRRDGFFNGRIVNNRELTGPRIVLGDFNDWLRGGVSRVLQSHLKWADARQHLGRSRTYPRVLPLFLLDHICFDSAFSLESLHLHKRRKAFIASDHLPLLANFRIDIPQLG